MDSSELTRRRAAAANVYVARQNPVDADMVTRNNRLKAAAQAFVAPYNQAKYINAPCCPPTRTDGAASDYGDSRLDEASFSGTAINTFTNVMDRHAGAAICCGPPPATTLPQGVQLYGDCSCFTAPANLPTAPANLPTAPTITEIYRGLDSLSIFFTPPSSFGDGDLLGYDYSLDGGVTYRFYVILDFTYPLTNLNVININEINYVVIRAVTTAGRGLISNEVRDPRFDRIVVNITVTEPNSEYVLDYRSVGTSIPYLYWGDGVGLEYSGYHTYALPGNYTIQIPFVAGDVFTQISMRDGPNAKTISVSQWGRGTITSLNGSFINCTELIYVVKIPDGLTNMQATFQGASKFNQDISDWNVSNVTDMENTFYDASSFNQPLNSWDVSNVTTMKGMFYGATSFNQPLNSWNVDKVIDMYQMFQYASSFNQPLNNWLTSINVQVNTMRQMFLDATVFNQDISMWNVSKVTDMLLMFSGAQNFNQNLTPWDVSNVNNMSAMFSRATSFNNGGQPFTWGSKTNKVTDMSAMFSGASLFNQDISGWDVSNVTTVSNMFGQAISFNQNLSSWNIGSKLTNMMLMFNGATAFNSPLNWGSKVSNVTNMVRMFQFTSSFNQDISGWDVSKVTNMNSMFLSATSFNNGGQSLNWGSKTSNVTNMASMFDRASSFNQDISGWNVSKVASMNVMFRGATAFNQFLTSWTPSLLLTNITNMFCNCISMSYPANEAKYPQRIKDLIAEGKNVNC